MSIEDVLEDALVDALQYTYGASSKESVRDILWLRARCVTNQSIITDELMVKQLIDDLFLPIDMAPRATFHFLEAPVFATARFETNSLLHIVQNWMHDFEFRRRIYRGQLVTMLERLNQEYLIIERNALRKSHKRKKKSSPYPGNVQFHLLSELNSLYSLHPSHPKPIPGIAYPEGFPWQQRSLDEQLDAYHHAEQQTAFLPAEADLESYVIHHLDDIEPGLQYMGRQIQLPHGRLDILARDSSGNYVVIELKVVPDDPNVLWQSVMYPKGVQSLYHVSFVRVLIVCPNLAEHIYIPLMRLGSPEIIYFKAIGWNGSIETVDFTKDDIARAA